ncbi:MAG: OmpA family protein [Pseudomonadota bacterium]
MRLSALFSRLVVFVLAAIASVYGAAATVIFVEDRSVVGVREVMLDAGHDWASVLSDGLQVILEGEAPSEAARFRAISAAGTIVDASRVIDNMDVKAPDVIAPPDFAIEILRNDSGVSLIGLIPADTDRKALIAQIGSAAEDQTVTDLLEVADYTPPDTWNPALTYAVRALEELPRTKISVSAKSVAVSAITQSEAEKATLETRLGRNQPDDVDVTLVLTAPRPVISPFLTRFVLDETGARFDACAVDGPDAREKIVAAASAAGFTGESGCIDALGVPSKTWGDAVALAIGAVTDLGGGTVTVSDTDVALVALQGTSERTFDNVVGRLESALPDVYALASDLPKAPEENGDGPPTFTITQSSQGTVMLRGRLPDDLSQATVENFAKSKFGVLNVNNGTRIGDDLPSGWIVRVFAGIEAMAQLSNGSVSLTPDTISVSGQTGREDAQANVSSLITEKLGPTTEFEMDIEYVKALDPIAGLPTPEECIAQIEAVTRIGKITFDPGASSLTDDANPIMDEIADILRRCPNLQIRIAGYTDSQGREEMNLQLSQDRASAVLTALRERRVPVGTFEAIGFGEENPIADNGTEAGREANRRIEFSLIVAEEETDSDAASADDSNGEETTDEQDAQ